MPIHNLVAYIKPMQGSRQAAQSMVNDFKFPKTIQGMGRQIKFSKKGSTSKPYKDVQFNNVAKSEEDFKSSAVMTLQNSLQFQPNKDQQDSSVSNQNQDSIEQPIVDKPEVAYINQLQNHKISQKEALNSQLIQQSENNNQQISFEKLSKLHQLIAGQDSKNYIYTSTSGSTSRQFQPKKRHHNRSDNTGADSKQKMIQNMKQDKLRQQLMDMNQVFQDSMMVINSTQMKLSDPREKDKLNQFNQSQQNKQARINADIPLKNPSQLINITMHTVNADNNETNKRDSYQAINTEKLQNERCKETSQSLYMCNSKINDSPSTPKRNPFQSQIYPKEQVQVLQQRCTTQLPQTCNSPILVSKSPDMNLANSSLKQRKISAIQSINSQRINDGLQICNPVQLLRQDLDIPDEHIDGFIGYLEQQKLKIQQNSVINPLSQRRPQIGSTNFNGPFKQLSNSPFRKLRQFRKNNTKLSAEQQIDQLKVECFGKQIIGIQRKNVGVTNKKNLDMQYAEQNLNMSMPSFQDQKFAGSSTLYPDASASYQLEEAGGDKIKIQKMFFKTNLIDLMKKDSLICPQSPVSEEEGILNVFVRSKDQLPLLPLLEARQQEGQASSPTSQQMDEDEFTYYNNHLLTSSFERPENQEKKNSADIIQLNNQNKQHHKENYQYRPCSKSFMKTQNKRIETSNESKASSQINNNHIYSDKTIQNSDFIKNKSDNQVDEIGEKPNTETRNSQSPGAVHSRSNSLGDNQSYEQMATQTTPNIMQPIESRQQPTTALMTPQMQYQFNPTFSVGTDSFTKPRGSNPGNEKEPGLEVQSGKQLPKSNNRTRHTQNDKIQSHVQMKLQHLRDLNNDKSNSKLPISTSQLQEICQSTLPQENTLITNTKSANKVSNSILKTTTLELTASAVGSSMKIDRGDSQNSSQAVNQCKIKNYDFNKDLNDVSQLDTQMTTTLLNQQASPNGDIDPILITKKIQLQPRDMQNYNIDQQSINWIQSGRPQVNIQIQNHHMPNESHEPSENTNKLDNENEQSIYLNKHVTGGLPALRKHPQPITSFFISKQKNNKKLQDRYGKVKDTQQDLQMILSQRNQNYSAPKHSMNHAEDMNFRDFVTTAMLKKKNFEDIINSIAIKPNTARNSMMRVCPTKGKQFEIEPPRTAAKTFRFGLQELHQQNQTQILQSKKSENIKLEENLPMVAQPPSAANKDIKLSLEKLMNANNNIILHQSRRPLHNKKKINILSVDFSRKSNSKSPKNQADDADELNQIISMREQALQSPQHVCLHIKNIQLNTSPQQTNMPHQKNTKFIKTNFVRDDTNQVFNKQSFNNNQDYSVSRQIQKQDPDSVKHQKNQFSKFKKLSPIKIANFGANKAKEILNMLPNTPISSDLKNSDFRYSTDQNQNCIKQSMDDKRESNIETSYILSQRHQSRNNSHKKLISGQDNQRSNINQPNLDSVTNISGFAHSQREQSTIIGDENQNDKSPSNYSPFGLKSNEVKTKSQIQNHLHMLKRELKRKRESQIQESLQPLVQQVSNQHGNPQSPVPQIQHHARSPDFEQYSQEGQPLKNEQIDDEKLATQNVLIQNSNIEQAQNLELQQLNSNINAASITEPSEEKQVLDSYLEAPSFIENSFQIRTDSVDLQKKKTNFIHQNKSRQAYDKVANFTQVRNTGYNDFYSYMDKVPLCRDDRKNKHTVKAFIQINQKKRQREQLMKQRRLELFQQVQHVLDSSRPVLPNSTPKNNSSIHSQINDNRQLNCHNLSARMDDIPNQNQDKGKRNEEDTVEYPMSLNMSELRNNEMQMTPNPNYQMTSLRTSNTTEQVEQKYQQLNSSIIKNADDMIQVMGRNHCEENTDRVTLYKSSRRVQDQVTPTQSPIPKNIGGYNKMSQSFYNKNTPASFYLVRPESDTQVQ